MSWSFFYTNNSNMVKKKDDPLEEDGIINLTCFPFKNNIK